MDRIVSAAIQKYPVIILVSLIYNILICLDKSKIGGGGVITLILLY